MVNPPPAPGIDRIVILGHTGFIGRHLMRWVADHVPAEVVGCSLPETDLTQERDAMALTRLFTRDTAVVMCAAIKRQLGDTVETFDRNVRMVVNLARAIEAQPVRRVLYYSSAAVYGEALGNTQITEDTPVAPTSLYGAAKVASECLLQQVAARTETSCLVLRPALVYGPGDEAGGYGPTGFVRAVLAGKPIALWGDGQERREFVFVEDVVRLVCSVLCRRQTGVLNVVSGRSYTYADIVEILKRLVPGRVVTTVRPRTKPNVDHGFLSTRLKSWLPDFSFTSLEQGVRLTLEAGRQGESLHAVESMGGVR